MKCTVNLTMVLWYLYHVKKARMQLNLFPVGKQIIVSQRYTVSDMHRKCYTMERNYIASSGLLVSRSQTPCESLATRDYRAFILGRNLICQTIS